MMTSHKEMKRFKMEKRNENMVVTLQCKKWLISS